MRKRIPTSKLSLGLLRPGLNSPRLPWTHAGARFPSAHLAWAALIANRFFVRLSTRGFARAQLIDLVHRDVIRNDNRTASLVTRFDQRQWVRNAFKNVLLQQQLFVTRPMTWSTSSEPPKPLTVAHPADGSNMTMPMRAPVRGTSASLKRPYGGFVVHKPQYAKSVASPLILACSPTNRSINPGRTQAQGEQSETTVTMITRRYQRVEVKRERMTTEFMSAGQTEGAQRIAFPRERLGLTTTTRLAARPRPLEDASMPIRELHVTQVADEVMKQLDRRLVTARERMGKI